MNQTEKGQRYNWLLEEHKIVERQINEVPKLPLDQTLQDLDSKEYSPQNQKIIEGLKHRIQLIDLEVKKLF